MIALIAAAAMTTWTRPAQSAPQIWRFQSDPVAWVHERAGIVLPLNVGAFGIGKQNSANPGGTDEAATYRAADGRVATVYVFRPPVPLAPSLLTLIERSVGSVRDSDQLDWTETPLSLGGGAPDALKAVAVGRYLGRVQATGIAVARYGSWVVVVRLTGEAQAAPAVSAGLEEMLRAVRPAHAPDPLDPQRIEPCKTAKPVTATAATVKPDSTTLLLDATLYATALNVVAVQPSAGLTTDTVPHNMCAVVDATQKLPLLKLRAKPSAAPHTLVIMGDAGAALDIGRATSLKAGAVAPVHVALMTAGGVKLVQYLADQPGDAQLNDLIAAAPRAAPLASVGFDPQRKIVTSISPEAIAK